ncbi:MAG TPA: type IV pilus assembly protein PilM [Candidatus Saccharimonadales bacterium]|nr:type IV pilus assembly protein PilM [Candidatus Saccharimonadales bacterium]
MSIITGVSDFFGLDIGTSNIRLVQLRGSGKTKTLIKYAYAPVNNKISMSDSKADQQQLAQAIKELLNQAHIGTRNAAVGVPAQKVFTTVVDFNKLSPSELSKTIPLQADSIIPTPIAESKMDWAVLGQSPADQTKLEVLVSSIPNAFVEARLDLLESIGLNVIAFEPDTMALARSVIPADVVAPQLVLDIGSKSADLVIQVNGAPRLTRSIPTGTEAIIRSAMQTLNIDEKQAHQFIFKFGLSKDKLEGQIYQAIIGTVDLLMTDIEKSIKFFSARYNNMKIERIIVTGGASTLPELPLYIANKFGVNVEIGNAWRNVTFPASRQNELLTVSNYFAVAAGLAERNE